MLLAGVMLRAAADPLPVYVDASAPPGGDGSEARPLVRLQQALDRPGPARVRLAPGLYSGPFVLPPGSRVEGRGVCVLTAEGEGAVVEAGEGSTLTGVQLQGAHVGLQAMGAVELEEVGFSGQRKAAVRVGPAGRLSGRRLRLQASVSRMVGLQLAPKGRALLEDVRFEGPFRRGVDALPGASVRLEDAQFDGSVTAVQLEEAEGELVRVRVRGGRGIALFAGSGSTLRLRDVSILGHEYGVLARNGARIEGTGLFTQGSSQAGVALVNARAELTDLVALDSGVMGAVQSAQGELSLHRFTIVRARSYGISALGGHVLLRDGVVVDITNPEGAMGDGVHLRRVQAHVQGLTVRRAAGACLQAAEGARVQLDDAALLGCRVAAVLAEGNSHVEARSLTVREPGGASVSIPDGATVRIEAATLEAGDGQSAWVECGSGSELVLFGVRLRGGGSAGGACVHLLDGKR